MLVPICRLKQRNILCAGLCVATTLLLLGFSHTGLIPIRVRFTDPDDLVPSLVWKERAERVRQAFAHAYHGYEQYAMPRDELRPITKEGMNGSDTPIVSTVRPSVLTKRVP
jgi:Glycosyl hydrolase family 47.